MAEKTSTQNAFSKSEAFRFGWETTKKNFWFIAALVAIPIVISECISFISQPLVKADNGYFKLAGFLLTIAGYFVSYSIGFGSTAIFLKLADKKKTEIKELFSYFDLKLICRFFVVSLIYGLLVIIGLLLFIVPGLYFATKYCFVSYIFVDKRGEIGIIDAFKESARLTERVKMQIFMLMLLQGLIIIAGLLALLVGALVAIPVVTLAYVYVYRKLQAKA